MDREGVLTRLFILALLIYGLSRIGFCSISNSANNTVHQIKTVSKGYFDYFNISFSGIVVSKKEIYSNIGIIKLELIETTDSLYDVRQDSLIYFCVIKEDLVEVITRYSQIEIGDSLIYKGDIDSLYIYREGILEEFWAPHINNNTNIFMHIRKKHDL